MKQNTKIYEIASALVVSGKGILAADESDPTAGKRLSMVNLPNEPENRQDFREMLFTAPGIEKYLSGVIMYDSTLRNSTDDGMLFPDVLMSKGIIPGIKVDMGTRDLYGFRGEFVTQGLDNLYERLKEYYNLGARFAKWRSVITIDGDETPTEEAIEMNVIMMVRYAQIAQSLGVVPIVEPEVIFSGDHSLQRSELVTTKVLQILFHYLIKYRVDLSGLILKSSMVLAGDSYPEETIPEEVANATVRTFRMSVPAEVAGIVLLSGGQDYKRATANLNAIAKLGRNPWPITFSFSRAIEEPVLLAWGGKPENVGLAQDTLLETVKNNSEASLGKLTT